MVGRVNDDFLNLSPFSFCFVFGNKYSSEFQFRTFHSTEFKRRKEEELKYITIIPDSTLPLDGTARSAVPSPSTAI